MAQSTQPQSGASPQTTAPGDDLAQMRTDLNQMDGLLNNMSSEIEFLPRPEPADPAAKQCANVDHPDP